MSKDKTLEVKESRVRELAGECSDYKKAMQILFPEALKEKNSREDITEQIRWYTYHSFVSENYWVRGDYGEDEAFIYLDNHGVHFNYSHYPDKYEICREDNGFRVFKR